MIGIEDLLREAVEKPPCGPDLSADLRFVQLDELARGKPEQRSGNAVIPAVPPPWTEVSEGASALLVRSKDLRLAMLVSRAGLALEGLPGLADGMQLIHGLLDRYWEDLHPNLDPEDGDTTERENALAAFADRPIGETSPIGFSEVRGAAVFRSRRLGQATIRDIEIGLGRPTGAKDPGVSHQKLLEWARAAAKEDPESYAAAGKALQGARRAHKLSTEIERLLVERLKGRPSPTFKTLRQILDPALVFEPAFGGENLVKGETGSTMQPASSLEAPESPAETIVAIGTIRTREEAAKLLDLVCEFLERTEPANPAPLLIQRAKRLMTMSFVEIVKELAPDSLAQIEKISGQKLTK